MSEGEIGDSLGDHVADRILTELRRVSPAGMSRGRIASDLLRGVSPVRVSLALALLSDRGLVRSEHRPGMSRAYEMWYAAEEEP